MRSRYEAMLGVLSALLLAGLPSARAGDEVESRAIRPKLDPDKGLLAKIAALGENEALLLPKPKIVGEFNAEARKRKLDQNGPRGRDFSLKTVWAADRKRALFCGGSYGSPINDVWEYDLAANTWALLFPPDPHKPPKGSVVKDGMAETPRGATAHATHSWWQITYDVSTGDLLWVNAKHRQQGTAKGLGAEPKTLYQGPHMWGYNPWKDKWWHQTTKQKVSKELARGIHAAGFLEYIPELKRSVWFFHQNGTWLYDAKARTWKSLIGPRSNIGGENVGCYDFRNKILVAHRGEPAKMRSGKKRNAYKVTHHLDMNEPKAWKKVLTAGEGDTTMPMAHDRNTSMYYDPHSGHCLLYRFPERKLWSYDAKATKWTVLAPKGAAAPKHFFKGDPSYFDPERNVFVIMNVEGVWVYRYKKATME